MTVEEFEPLFDGRNPVMMNDGSVLLIIRFFAQDGEIGLQKPGAAEIIWSNVSKIGHEGGGAFKEL